MKIGWIGMGNMGSAMLAAAAAKMDRNELCFYEPEPERAAAVSAANGVRACDSAAEVSEQAKLLVLAIKPQHYEAAALALRPFLQEHHIVLSIAPGHSLAVVSELLGGHRRVVRAMPNTPALIGQGMTGMAYESEVFSVAEEQQILEFLETFSEVEVVKEEQLAAVTCISGSSPAYVDLFIETLADVGVRYGLSRRQACHFAAKAVAGAAEMVLQTGEHPAVLKDKVCSPGGTTIAAVEALEAGGFRHSIWEAGRACHAKIIEMQQETDDNG
ncbi:MAG: pyrroline-5-carboxylate reductase [Lachnospiraceae bacterium]|nr:pyrroline-5-carboxylate reductase [Lachnospiraceae bacterium]MDY5741743.1 pyrroline-5-carboxylate reductase [Lachnospiraceae bacterium]